MRHNIHYSALAVAALSTPIVAMGASKKGDAKQPNILFCIADDASFHHFSKAGCSWVSTPNFDRVATEGIFFDACYTPNAKSAPSRATVLTGRYSWQLGEAGNHNCHFPSNVKVFTEVLSEKGYDVAYTGKGWAPGNPGTVGGKTRLLTGRGYQKHKYTPVTKKMNVIDYGANFSDFLDDNAGEKPWFFWFGSFEPHRAYEFGTGISVAGKNTDMIDEVPPFWADNQTVRTDMLDYALEIEEYDRQIGELLAELERRGELENTLIIVTSDNGMPFPRCKANNYEYSTHMPFAIMWPKGLKAAGRTVEEYVNFVDIAPTILDAAGVEADGMLTIAGASLMPIIKNELSDTERKEREVVYFGRERDDYGRPLNQGYPIRAVMRDDVIYIHNLKAQLFPAGNPEAGYLDVDGSPTKTDILDSHRAGEQSDLWQLSMGFRPEVEMYDLKIDKYCVNNLAGDPAYADVQAELCQILLDYRNQTHDPRLTPNGSHFDSYIYNQNEQAWDFYERIISGELQEPWKKTNWVNPTDYEWHPDNY